MVNFRRFVVLALVASAVTSAVAENATAQGVTTGAVTGVVTDTAGNPLSDVQIRAVNKATGFSSGTLSREGGRYVLQGLDVGTYEITARRIGFSPQVRDNIIVALSQTQRVDFRIAPQPVQLTGVKVVGSTGAETFSASNTGTKAVVTDTTIQRLPTLTRNLTDFIKLTPQVSASGPGYSAGGMSNRMNNVQIDGATERDVFGLGSTGQPGAQVNAKSVGLEAVKEFQVLLAPYDVRQGNFGGVLLNAVTKSGTNTLQGSAFTSYRDEDWGKDTVIVRGTPFRRAQYGFSLGGPLIKDKLHFFISPEWQSENAPLSGPFQGQPATTVPAYPVSDANAQRFQQIMQSLGENSLGTAGFQGLPNPLTNFFGRLDWRANDTHRAVFRFNYANAERPRDQNSRQANRAVYSGNLHDFSSQKIAPVFQLYSNFGNGSFNELFIGLNRVRDRRIPRSPFPQITVQQVPLASGTGNGTIVAGADQFSQGNEVDMDTYELTNNFTTLRGNHSLTFGTRNEYVKIRNLFTQSSYGVWAFRNLDSLAAGNANSFRKAIILSQGGNVFFDLLSSAWYAQDQWTVSPKVTLTLGMRADFSYFPKDIAYNAAIDSAYGRRTDDIPSSALQWSPRVGFNWDVTGNQVNQIRGGVGLFVGTPPGVWLANAYANNGNIITFLNCNTAGSTAPAPAFQVNPSSIASCRNGQGTRPIGDVNFVNSSLKFPQPLRATLAYDRELYGDLIFTLEGLFSKTLNQFFFVNRNIVATPTGTDRFGRTVYADSIRGTNGVAFPAVPAGVRTNGGTARFSTAIDLLNQSKDYAYNLTAQVRKRYSNNWEGIFAYTYSQARDVQSFTSSTHISNWQFGRTLAGNQLDPYTSISLFQQPHKVLAQGTYTLDWSRKLLDGRLRGLATDFTMFYEGTSGAPHDYVYNSVAGGSGDLNGDGRQGNDLIYVPTSATNTAELVFRDIPASGTTPIRTAAEQAAAFENFIKNSSCLSKYRGQILPRNSCAQPFVNRVDLAIRQGLPQILGRTASVQFDIFNFGNLLNSKWGQIRQTDRNVGNSNTPLLQHVGQTSSDPRTAVPIVQFDLSQREYAVQPFVSNFWRTQVAFRLSF